jgi:hypothetical protein
MKSIDHNWCVAQELSFSQVQRYHNLLAEWRVRGQPPHEGASRRAASSKSGVFTMRSLVFAIAVAAVIGVWTIQI